MCLGEAIKRVMESHGLNVQTLAGALDPPVREITVQRWVDGEVNKIPLQAIMRFAVIHKLSLCQYLEEMGVDCHCKPKKK